MHYEWTKLFQVWTNFLHNFRVIKLNEKLIWVSDITLSVAAKYLHFENYLYQAYVKIQMCWRMEFWHMRSSHLFSHMTWKYASSHIICVLAYCVIVVDIFWLWLKVSVRHQSVRKMIPTKNELVIYVYGNIFNHTHVRKYLHHSRCGWCCNVFVGHWKDVIVQ